MNSPRLLIFLSVPIILLIIAACGKKAPPFLPQNTFNTSVYDLTGEWDEGEIILKGSISPSVESGETEDLVKGARIYYAHYSFEEAPCAECPVAFHGYDTFEREVIVEGDFLFSIPNIDRDKVYFYRVHLIGAEGAMGPPSNTVRVVEE